MGLLLSLILLFFAFISLATVGLSLFATPEVTIPVLVFAGLVLWWAWRSEKRKQIAHYQDMYTRGFKPYQLPKQPPTSLDDPGEEELI